MTAMQITFTQHALARMAERGISQAEVLATLAQPVRTIDALTVAKRRKAGLIARVSANCCGCYTRVMWW